MAAFCDGVVETERHCVCCVLTSDVDECEELAGICEHGQCSNLLGSFSCTCSRGYRLSPNRDTCTGQIHRQSFTVELSGVARTNA